MPKLENLRDAVALFSKSGALKAYALRAIRDDKLHLEEGYDTFKECAELRLGVTESYAYRLIRYADYLEWVGLDIWTVEAVPAEGSVRGLISHSANRPDLAERIYSVAVELSDGDPARITKMVADEAIQRATAATIERTPFGEGGSKRKKAKESIATIADLIEPNLHRGEQRPRDPEGTAIDAVEGYCQTREQVTYHEISQFVHSELSRITFIRQWLMDYEAALKTKITDLVRAA